MRIRRAPSQSAAVSAVARDPRPHQRLQPRVSPLARCRRQSPRFCRSGSAPKPFARTRAGSGPSVALLALPLALAAVGCYSNAELRDRADRDAYALIDERRQRLFGEQGLFKLPEATEAFGREGVAADVSTLRMRLLTGLEESVDSLTIVDALRIASENSQRVQEQKESLYISALDLTQEQWQFGYRYQLDGSATGSGSLDDASLVPVNGGLGASVTRVLGSGAVIVGNIGSDLFRFVSTGDGWDTVTNLGLSITQPLLRGSGRLVTLEPLRQTERNLIYSVRNYERFRRTFAVDVAAQVFSTLQAQNQYDNELQRYENLVQLSLRNQALAEAGDLSKIEVDQAQQGELNSENSLVRLRGNIERQYDGFNVFLGLPVGVDVTLAPGILEALGGDSSFIEGLNQDVVVEFAIENRLDVMTSFDRVQDAVRREAIARDALRTGLGLSVSANSASDEGRPLGYTVDDVQLNAALDADLPVDLLPLRNAWRRSEIALVDERRAYERFLDNVAVSARDALRRARNSYASYEIQADAVNLSLRRVEAARVSQKFGRASTRDFLEAQQDLQVVQDGLTTAKINYELALYDLWLELEVLRVDERGIYIDEEMTAELKERSAAAGGPKPRPGIPGAADGAGDDENTEGENEDAESALSPEPSPEREDQ